jgi:hypothetical protein
MNAWKNVLLPALSLVVMAFSPVGAAHAQVKVTAATPSSAVQGTVNLDVIVSGSGFDSTSTTQFFVTGTTNPGGITVKKTTFRSSKEVVATIDVADMAEIASFDIQVTLSSGRKGKGTTLFMVNRKAEVADPCLGATAAFVVDKESPNAPRTLYLANAAATCLRPLYTFNSVFLHNSSFRIVDTDGVQEGRVVVSDGGDDLLFIRFPIGPDMRVDPASISVRRVFDPQQVGFVDNTFFDLAADGRRLAYVTTAEDGSSSTATYLYRLRVLEDVESCASALPNAATCAHDAGALLAERVGTSQMIAVPRWSPDAAWIYLEDRRGDFYRPYISRVSPAVPLTAGQDPEIVVAGGDIWFFEMRSSGAGDVMVYGEREGLACHQVRVVPTASCSGGTCSAQLNSLSPRLPARWATLQSIQGSTLTFLVAGAKEDRRGRCTSTNDIVRAVDSPGTGVLSATVLSGAHMPVAK